MKTPLTGIIPPLVTPLRDQDTIDDAGLERHLERMVRGGVAGVFVLGTTGEGPSLSYQVRRDLITRVTEYLHGRIPVLVGITDTSFVESMAMARHAAKNGADAVVLAPPYYLPEGQEELREYLGHVIKDVPLPLFLYNMPALTKVVYEPDTVRWAMDQDRIVGLKDSSGDLSYFSGIATLLSHRPDWSLLMGPEELLLRSLKIGGMGGVSGGANLFPHLYVSVFEACTRGDHHRAEQLQALILRISGDLDHIGRHSSSIITGIRCGLRCLGVCDDFMAEPFHRFREPERALVAERINAIVDALSAAGIPAH